MGLKIDKLVAATNENDILDRFFTSGKYEKKETTANLPTLGIHSDGAAAHPSGVQETLSPAMDILVSSNFERLLYLLSLPLHSGDVSEQRSSAGRQVASWMSFLKSFGSFSVPQPLLKSAQQSFWSRRVSDPETMATIMTVYAPRGSIPGLESYVLDPHSAVGVTAAWTGSILEEGGRPPQTHTVALATAHPAKFAGAVELALSRYPGFNFEKDILPKEFKGLEKKKRRVRAVGRKEGVEGMRRILREEVKNSQK